MAAAGRFGSSSLRHPWRLLAIAAAAAALNLVPLELLGGARILVGSFVTVPALLLVPAPWGVLIASAALAPTLFTFGHPFAFLLGTAEALALAYGVRRLRINALLADTCFWALVGVPLGWWWYAGIGRLPADLVTLTLAKQILTQLMATLVAVFVVRVWPANGSGASSQHRADRIRSVVFNYMFVLTAIPLALGALAFSVLSREAAEQEARTQMQDSTRDVARQVDTFLTLHQATLVGAAHFLERSPDAAPALIEAIRQSHPTFITLLVADRDGRIVHTAPTEAESRLRGLSIEDREYFRAPRRDGIPFVSGVFRGRGFGNHLLVGISIPLYNAHGFAGILQGSLEIERFSRAVMDTNEADVEMILADGGGRVIFADAGTRLSPLADLRFTAFGALLNSGGEAGPVAHDRVIDGEVCERVHSYATRCEHFDFIAVAQFPVLAGFKPLRITYLLGMMLFAGVICSTIVLARAARRQLSSPLEHFARETVRQATSGTVGPISAPPGRQPLEIRLVFHAFNRLAARLQTTYSELRLSNEQLDLRVAERTREAEAARNHAEAVSRSKTDFLAMTGHEIRTPLNAIIGIADLAALRARDPVVVDQLAIIRGAGEGLLRVVNDLLDLSRVEAGKLELVVAPLELAELRQTVLGLFGSTAQRQKLDLRFEMAADVPARIRTDGARLQQVLFNLVGNALKFTREGTVRVRIQRVASRNGAVTLRFAVVDTGPGIPLDQQDRLFKAYSQLGDAGGAAASGSGLGLMISHRLVALLGGELRVRSAAGAGAEFFFALEVEPAAAPIDSAAPPALALKRPAASRRWRVLIADDNLGNQEVLRLMIEPRCEHLVVVGSGADAIKALQGESFDVALLDLDMPDCDGFTVARGFRQSRKPGAPSCQLLAVSAHRRDERWPECAAAGFDGFVEKPINRAGLLRHLDEHVAAS